MDIKTYKKSDRCRDTAPAVSADTRGRVSLRSSV